MKQFYIKSVYRPFLLLILLPVTVMAQQSVPKIRIDPDRSCVGAASQYIDQIKYISLEATKGSLFGDIHQLAVADSGYLIYDEDREALLYFSLMAKFIRKVKLDMNRIVGHISLDEDHKRIAVSIYDGLTGKRHIEYYSLSGEQLPADNPAEKQSRGYTIEFENIAGPDLLG